MPNEYETDFQTYPVPLIKAKIVCNPIEINILQLHELLNNSGAVILRGFDFNLENLEIFTNSFCHQFHTPATRSARKVSGDNYSTEVFPHNYTLLGHTEGSYRPNHNPPEICFFMCVTPPVEKGGETTLADGIKFLELLPDNIRQKFEKFGIIYEMYWEKERWQNEFFVYNIEDLKIFLENFVGVKYSLTNEDELHLFYTTPAITKSMNGNQVFANALLAHLPKITHPKYINKTCYSKPSNRVYYGDGEEIPDGVINELTDIYDNILYAHSWQKKDVLVIDNTRYLHGRKMTEKDCERKLISRFGRLNFN